MSVRDGERGIVRGRRRARVAEFARDRRHRALAAARAARDADPARLRRVRALRAVAYVVVAMGVTVLVGLGVARATVLRAEWYDTNLERSRAYDRLYDEVLVDPEMADLTRDLLARLPVPSNQVTANLRLALPPSTLRGITHTQIGHTVAWLRGDEADLRFVVDLKPVINNLGGVAEIFVGDLTGDVPRVTEDNAPDFTAAVQVVLDDLAAGRRPTSLPSFVLAPEAAPEVADIILERVPAERRAELREPVVAALRSGDLGGVLVTIVPALYGDQVMGARDGLAGLSENGRWDLVVDIRAKDTSLNLGPLPQVRALTVLGLGRVLSVTGLLTLAGLAVLWVTAPARGGARLRGPGAALVAGGLAAALTCLIAWAAVPHVIPDDRGDWAPSVRALTADLQADAVRGIVVTWLVAAAVPVFFGALVFAAGTVFERLRGRGRVPDRRRWAHGLTATAGLVVAGALALTVLVPSPTVGSADDDRRCNGSVQLCDRRYDEVTFLATHNSMSSTANRFVSPLQDPDIVTQLDSGVRALLVDTYHWESPDEIAGRIAGSDLSPADRQIMAGVVDSVAPARPGLWLCHSLCRGGAVELVQTLREVKDWLDRNPGEVVTMIVQDAVSGEETEAAFAAAGLGDLLFTPPADPGAPWPTLRQMIDTGRRLVVFAERADGPAPWYRNFYTYGMETPYAFSGPQEMSCAPNRGGEGKRLFLLNHFITATGGSRIDAGVVNARSFVLDRARACERERGHPVNFVAVDFATIGDAGGAVDILNLDRGPRRH